MPAAAVIPAPIAYTKVVAVKKLVVGFLLSVLRPSRKSRVLGSRRHPREGCVLHLFVGRAHLPSFTVSKLECSKQAYAVEYISME